MGVFQLESKKLSAIKHSVSELAKLVYAKAIFKSKGQNDRSNSGTIEISYVMFKFWKKLTGLSE